MAHSVQHLRGNCRSTRCADPKQTKPGQMSHTARPAHRWVHVGRQCAASLRWCVRTGAGFRGAPRSLRLGAAQRPRDHLGPQEGATDRARDRAAGRTLSPFPSRCGPVCARSAAPLPSGPSSPTMQRALGSARQGASNREKQRDINVAREDYRQALAHASRAPSRTRVRVVIGRRAPSHACCAAAEAECRHGMAWHGMAWHASGAVRLGPTGGRWQFVRR
jgi:hypothetical protein